MKKEISKKQGGGGVNAIEKRNIIIGVTNLSELAQEQAGGVVNPIAIMI